MDGKGISDEVSDRNEARVVRQRKKGNTHYKVAKILAKLCSCSSDLWKVDLVSNKLDI